MSWFVFELRREDYATTELREFPLLEAALKHAIDHLMMLTRADRQMSIGLGEIRGPDVDWLGELQLDDQGRPRWNSAACETWPSEPSAPGGPRVDF